MRFLTALAASAAVLAGAASARAECPADAPLGVYEGSAGSNPLTRIDFTVNLVCADGRYRAQVFSSLGDLLVRDVSGGPGRAKVSFEAFRSLAVADLQQDGDHLTGGFTLGASKGQIALTRIGPPLQPDAWGPRLDLTPAQWREDVEAFAAKLPRRHANAFAFLPMATFEAEIARLKARLPRLNGDHVFVELERITNTIGDGHTGIVFPPDRATLPFTLGRFGQDIRVTAAGPGLERTLGAKLLRIGPTPIQEAWRRALTLTPKEELPELREARALVYLTSGLSLHGLGITPDRGGAMLRLKADTGPAFSLAVAAVPPGKAPKLTSAAGESRGLAGRHSGEGFWCEPVEGQAIVYCAFRSYERLQPKTEAMLALLDRTHPTKLIVDMRDNGGGDNTEGYRWLIAPIKARADINRKGRLYVLVGAETFSAAMNNAAQFQDQTQAILVGQEIGEKPNSYQEPRAFRLPNSHLQVRVSTLYYEFRKSGPNVVKPDKEIVPTWADVKAGRDPVLDWVLAQPAP